MEYVANEKNEYEQLLSSIKKADILALLQQNYIPAFVHENRGNLLPM